MPTKTKGGIAASKKFGGSPDAKAKMKEADDNAVWWGICRRCNETVTGKGKLTNHKCKALDAEAPKQPLPPEGDGK